MHVGPAWKIWKQLVRSLRGDGYCQGSLRAEQAPIQAHTLKCEVRRAHFVLSCQKKSKKTDLDADKTICCWLSTSH